MAYNGPAEGVVLLDKDTLEPYNAGSGSSALGAEYNATPPTYTDGDPTVLQTDASGRLITTQTQADKGRFWTDEDGVPLDVDNEYIGQVGGTTPRITATYAIPADATQFSIGDAIGNSMTAASVVPIEFNVTRTGALLAKRSGRLSGCRCVVTAASGTIVLPAFFLPVFRPEANIPFAAGSFPANNAAFNLSAAAMKELVGIFEFRVDDWMNQAGGATAAGLSIYQAVPLKPLSGSGRVRTYAPFNLASLASNNLQALMQAQNTWNPGAVVNTFDFALDADLD